MTPTPHIVVVDDEPFICGLVSRYLSDQSYRVTMAEDGLQMQRILDKEGADIVILDIMMPGEDGLSIARRLRSQSQIGIIMLTGKDELVDRVVGLEIGADDYLAKPFDNRELLARVRSLLRRVCETPSPPARGGRTAVFSG